MKIAGLTFILPLFCLLACKERANSDLAGTKYSPSIWSFAFPKDTDLSSFRVYKDTVIVLAVTLKAELDHSYEILSIAKDGRTLWRQRSEDILSGTKPKISCATESKKLSGIFVDEDNSLILTSLCGAMIGIDARDGKPRWARHLEKDDYIYSIGDEIFAESHDFFRRLNVRKRSIERLHFATGTVDRTCQLRIPHDLGYISSPTLMVNHSGNLIVSGVGEPGPDPEEANQGGRLYIFDDSCKLLHTFVNTFGDNITSLRLSGDKLAIYGVRTPIVSSDEDLEKSGGLVSVIDSRKGNILWQQSHKSLIGIADKRASDGDDIVILSENKDDSEFTKVIKGVKAQTGEAIWSLDTSRLTPEGHSLIAQGHVYDHGILFLAFQVKTSSKSALPQIIFAIDAKNGAVKASSRSAQPGAYYLQPLVALKDASLLIESYTLKNSFVLVGRHFSYESLF